MSTTEMSSESAILQHEPPVETDVFTDSSIESDNVQEWQIDQKNKWYAPIKFIVEYVISLMLFFLALPIVAIAAIATKLTSPGPIFYRQTRLGKDGKHFKVIKLRTMIHNAEASTGPVWASKTDSRITPIGGFLRSTHIDEFPQLINVLLGDMALVGPRPERPEIAQQLEWQVPEFTKRLQVRPGITGLAQLNLPPDSDIDGVRRKLLHDIYYITCCSPWLDIKILYTTGWLLVKTIIKRVFRFAILPDEEQVHTRFGQVVGSSAKLHLAELKADRQSSVR